MKRLILISLALLVFAGLALITGCNSKGTPPVEYGNVNDPEFQLVSDFVFQEALDGVGKIIDISWELFDSIPGVTPSPKLVSGPAALGEDVLVVDSFNYSYTNGWHVFSFWAVVSDAAEGDTVDLAGIDSMQTLDNGTPMQVPDTSMDDMFLRAHYDISLRNGDFNGSSDGSVDIGNIDWTEVQPSTISGNVIDYLLGSFSDTDFVVTFEFTNQLNANSIVADLGSEDCPTSGTLSLSSAVDISAIQTIGASVDTLNISGNWVVDAEFNNGNYTVTYYDGTTYWQTTEACSPSPSPISRWLPNLD